MRHLLALFALAVGLVACDDTATTAPADTIPGPPDAPRLSVTVLTGTKAAPVDSPTVKVQWWYSSVVNVGVFGLSDTALKYNANATYITISSSGTSDSTFKVGCAGNETIKYLVGAQGSGKYAADTVSVYCK